MSLAHSLGGATSGCTATLFLNYVQGATVAGSGNDTLVLSVQDEKAGLADSFSHCSVISTWKLYKDVSEALDA